MSAALVDALRGQRVGVIGNVHELAPWADFLAANDRAWWQKNPDAKQFAGRRFSGNRIPGVERVEPSLTNWCSGVLALQVAANLGATVVRLYGFDMHGTHYFGPYTNGLANTTAATREIHMEQFKRWRLVHAGVKVLNCTPGSALACFDFEVTA